VAAKALTSRHRLMLGCTRQQQRTERGPAMSSSDQENKDRNREIAENEARREVVSNVRVSTWAIAVTVIVGVIVFAIAWGWLKR
jgi:hypothetical protein